MFELQLIGYTAELGHLVLDLDGGGAGRYRLRVDADLFATLDELRERRRERGLPVGDLVEFAHELGLSREQLQRLDEDDARVAAAAGQVSTGSAVAEGWLAVPEEPPTWEEPGDPGDPPQGDTLDAPTEEPGGADAEEAGPTVLPGWQDEDDHDDASVRIVPGPGGRSRPAPDESDGLATRVLESHGLTAPGPDRDTPSWVDDAGSPTPSPEPTPESAPEPEPTPESGAALESEAASEPEPEPAPDPPAGPDRTPEPPPITVAQPVAGRTPPRPLVPTPAERDGVGPTREPPVGPEPGRRPEPVLSPAEIQARLRSGRSVRSVAKAAGVDEERIRRWEVPIVAERARVLEQAHALRLQRPRLGRSSRPLGEAVRRNLAARGVDPDDVSWETSRRRDGRWRVCVRYVTRGRRRSATWTYDPEEGELRAASDTARDLGFTRRQRR